MSYKSTRSLVDVGQVIVLLLVISAGSAFTPTSAARAGNQPNGLTSLLERARKYVNDYQATFATIICDEDYTQEVWELRLGSVGVDSMSGSTSGRRLVERRVMRSEFIFLSSPSNKQLLGFRDVLSVDGRRLPRGAAGITQLLSRAESDEDFSSLLAASSQYNIGPIYRNFNEPLLALVTLDSRSTTRFDWRIKGETEIGGVRTFELGFLERETPTVVRRHDSDLFMSGTIWIDPSDGHVLRTSVALVDDTDTATGKKVRGEMTVSYRRNAKLDMLVPAQMKETYSHVPESDGPRLNCVGTYSHYRRFETQAKIVKH